MGKRLITQRRGRGTLTYTAHGFRKEYRLSYPSLTQNNITGTITAIEHDAGGRESPIATVKLSDKSIIHVPAPVGIRVGSDVFVGKIEAGALCIASLSNIPEGSLVCNIEKSPGSGGIFCRAPGAFARLLGKTEQGVLIEFSSKKQKTFASDCRAVIGVVAGGGKLEKPLVKAGKRHHIMRARGKLYPLTSGVAMNAVDHPFGSGRGRHIGKSKVAPRNAPPGRNVGLIRARRTGRRR
jgi:large subunit ribosomal protein L2